MQVRQCGSHIVIQKPQDDRNDEGPIAGIWLTQSPLSASRPGGRRVEPTPRRHRHRRALRVVDPATFADDSLRVLRAVQFAARLAFTLDDDAKRLCRTIPLDDLPSERIWGEFEKLLLAPHPSIGFALAMELDVVRRLFPELQALAGCPQEPEWHPGGDVWVHTLQVIDQTRLRLDGLPRPQQIALMLGAVCHDLGKPATTAVIDGRIRSMDHEEQGVPPTLALLDRLNVQSIDGYDVRGQIVGLVAQHLKPGSWFKVRDEVGDGAFRRLAQKVDLELLARVAKADCLLDPYRSHRSLQRGRRAVRPATDSIARRRPPCRSIRAGEPRARGRSRGALGDNGRWRDGSVRGVMGGSALAGVDR